MDLRLNFYTRTGMLLGSVDWNDDEHGGADSAELRQIVSHRATRENCSFPEAMRSLDGWSNGYLTAKLSQPIP